MSQYTNEDYSYMARAISLAERGLYTTDPNPRVGCVIVREGALARRLAAQPPMSASSPAATMARLRRAAMR